MNTTLVVMAAGMGSRFGGLKQAAPITPDGKCILDFSVYDAKKAGFNKVVFIVREDMKRDFHEFVGKRISKSIDIDYVIQDMSELPAGRSKPFGTAHAILCCADAVKEPFAVINADDYYGSNAFFEINKHLCGAGRGEYAMVAYQLKNTLSKNGTVSRGVCDVEDGYLKSVTEVVDITDDMTCNRGTEFLAPDTFVSMNLWGLTDDIFEVLKQEYEDFLKNANLMTDEFFLPGVIGSMLGSGRATVKVYPNADKWYGITYREDLKAIKEAIGGYINDGLYSGI